MNGIEMRIVETLLNKPELIDSTYINVDWFTDIKLRNVVKAMQSLDLQERTLLNIFNEMDNDGSVEYKHLVDIQGGFITSGSFESDVKSLHKLYAQRNLEVSIEVYKQYPKKQELANLSEAIAELEKIDEAEDDGKLEDAIEELRVRLTSGKSTGIKSFEKLDNLLAGGLYGSMLFTIGARPSVGKTAYAVNLARQIVSKDPEVQVDFFTLEMNKREMLNRFISAVVNVDSQKLKNPSGLDLLFSEQVSAGINWVRNHKIRIYDRVLTLGGILSVIKKNAAKAKPDKYVAIIDYIGLVKVNGRQDRWLQVGKITRELKIIANEYNIPVIALAQLNRGVESRQNKEPLLSDLRESGSIEQDSNVVAFLYRPDEDNRELVKLSIRKNREGSLGDISYYFDGKYMYFKETDEVE
ncbi:replicative DNA helicase [Ligilactobacillus salivarius]|uniref:replicative DNA helicase n=1 Tax=Ligilactobacillus salivarius TaxID=1624 RepID=UPI001879B70F|nr:DnaB-like helicase C-terminal domain-containing protein [Ligilactobacillus salivarius]MBE7387039.1 DNA helicase [Ligilactobacillus salivarius]MBE7392288.1 DNA helicase [Ligilactobacillus salivarius]